MQVGTAVDLRATVVGGGVLGAVVRQRPLADGQASDAVGHRRVEVQFDHDAVAMHVAGVDRGDGAIELVDVIGSALAAAANAVCELEPYRPAPQQPATGLAHVVRRKRRIARQHGIAHETPQLA